MMSEGSVTFSQIGSVGHILFDRPEARNAMTWKMYDELALACQKVAEETSIKVATLRGVGGKAFIAGTDITQFQKFSGGEDGVDYEKNIEGYLSALLSIQVPTLAVIEGWAIGGGLAIAAACDIRIATPGTRFGVPIARTLGNCLSSKNLARLVAVFGLSRVNKMLLLSEMLEVDEAKAAGFLTEIVSAKNIGGRADEIAKILSNNAPVTLRVTKQALARIAVKNDPNDEDLIRECYGSQDFLNGVKAFVAKKKPVWVGE
jgi:enoyl-CoA hydratase